MKKRLSVALVIALTLAMSLGLCFAEAGANDISQPSPIPIKLTAPSHQLGIDFSVSEGINMRAYANTVDMVISDFEITNNANVGQIQLDSIQIQATSPWSIESKDTEFEKLSIDSKKFSMITEGYDLSLGTKTYADGQKLAPPGGTLAISFSGKTGCFLTALNDESVAKLIPTVSVY